MSPVLKAHLEASFRDSKANPGAARCKAGFSHKMASALWRKGLYRVARRIQNSVFSLTFQFSSEPTCARCDQITLSGKAFSDKAINFMPLVFKASDQCYLKDKLIFSFLPLLVWNALGNYWLNWLVFLNSLAWNQLMPVHITKNTLPVSLQVV